MTPFRIINPEDPATPPENPDSDEEEFVAALTAHQAALQAFIHSLMPGDSSCDDVLQRTNMTLWRKRQSFTLGTNFRA